MIGVKLEVERKAVSRGLTMDAAARSLAGQVGQTLGSETRTRVRERGDLGGQPFPGWRQRERRRYAVNPRYPDRASGPVGPSGAEWYDSRPKYHQANATRPGTYATTGGMWAGLSVVFEGPYRARIAFRGRSEGANPNFTRARRGKAKGRIVVRPLKINNALKASTVLRMHGVNVLALTEAQLERVARLCCDQLGLGISGALSVQWDRQPQPASTQGQRLPTEGA